MHTNKDIVQLEGQKSSSSHQTNLIDLIAANKYFISYYFRKMC